MEMKIISTGKTASAPYIYWGFLQPDLKSAFIDSTIDANSKLPLRVSIDTSEVMRKSSTFNMHPCELAVRFWLWVQFMRDSNVMSDDQLYTFISGIAKLISYRYRTLASDYRYMAICASSLNVRRKRS